MKGIEACATGRLGRDPESRQTKAGNTMVVINLAVDDDDDDTTWLKVLAFNDQAVRAATMIKGSRCYVEGALKLEQWTTQAGEHRAGLTLLARLVQPMGQIGRQRPKAAPRARQGAASDNLSTSRHQSDPDDPLPF